MALSSANKIGPERCPRCAGLMVREQFYDGNCMSCEEFWGARCLACGDIVDPLIIAHRRVRPTPIHSHRRWSPALHPGRLQMKKGRRVLQAIGALGLLSVLVVGGLSGMAWASDSTGKQTVSVAAITPTPTTLAVIPDPTANPKGEQSISNKKSQQADGMRTDRGKLLVILFLLSGGHRGSVP